VHDVIDEVACAIVSLGRRGCFAAEYYNATALSVGQLAAADHRTRFEYATARWHAHAPGFCVDVECVNVIVLFAAVATRDIHNVTIT
jgi:hypothetical protein